MMILSKYSPLIALGIAIVALIYFHGFFLRNVNGGDAAGTGMAQGYSVIIFYLIFVPYALLVAFSLFKFNGNPSAFSGKWIWNALHLSPLLIVAWSAFVFTVDRVYLAHQIRQNAALQDIRRDYTHAKHDDRFLTMKDDFVIYIHLYTDRGPSVDALGKVDGEVFESRWSLSTLTEERNFDLKRFKDLDGKTVLENYRFVESDDDFEAWYAESSKALESLKR